MKPLIMFDKPASWIPFAKSRAIPFLSTVFARTVPIIKSVAPGRNSKFIGIYPCINPVIVELTAAPAARARSLLFGKIPLSDTMIYRLLRGVFLHRLEPFRLPYLHLLTIFPNLH